MCLWWFLRRLLGDKVAAAATLLVSFDPFFLGHSRLLNHEGMLVLFVLISLLALINHLFLERRWACLLLSGAAAGLAQLTKSSSIVLLPVIGLLFLVKLTACRQSGGPRKLVRSIAELAAWLGTVALAYFLFWPGMWVAPGQMLYQVFGNALSYAFEGSRLAVTGGLQPPAAPLSFGGVMDYVQSMLWRTTPLVWLGVMLGIVALVRGGGRTRIILPSVALTGGLFVILFGVVSGRNSAHYVLTAYVALDIIAAAGYVQAAEWLAIRLAPTRQGITAGLITLVVVGIQAASALAFYPYYYNYFNPIMEASEPGFQDPNFGYGEGLDVAAAYLRSKPGAAESTVIVFYGRGPFSFFYPGKTEPLKPVYADAENVPQLRQILRTSEYLVIYYELEKDRQSPANVMRGLANAIPEESIWLNNIEYVRIYRVATLPRDFYAALGP